MTAFKGLGTYGDGAGVVTPLDHKLGNAGMVAKASATTIRPGLFWGGTGTIVSGKANMSYDVAAYTCVTQRSAAAGAVFGGNDGTLNLTTDVGGSPIAAPGSNSAYHVVFHWHREFSLDGTDSNPVIAVVQGTSAASPTVPSLAAYPGAIELARILVPAGVTATNSGTTITQKAPFTAMDGGRIPFRNTTERDAGTYLEGQLGWLVDTDTSQVYLGSSWSSLNAPLNVQADTTNSTERLKVQVGIGKVTGSAVASIGETVTFPVAFASIPKALSVTYVGTRATGSYNTSSLIASSGTTARASALTTTGFQLEMDRVANFSASFDYYYSWQAWGTE